MRASSSRFAQRLCTGACALEFSTWVMLLGHVCTDTNRLRSAMISLAQAETGRNLAHSIRQVRSAWHV